MPPIPVYIELDATANRWCFAKGSEEQRVWKAFAKGKGHQHEAAILLCLAELPEGDALPISAIQTLVQDRGRETKLNATGLKRLYESINHAGEIAGQAWRVLGKKTTGTWALEIKNGIKIIHQSTNPPIHQFSLSPISLTADLYNWEEIIYLLNQILSIDVAFNTGNLLEAAKICEKLLQSTTISSPMTRMVVKLRTVRVWIHLERFEEAHTLLKECHTIVTRDKISYSIFKEPVTLLYMRLRYDQYSSTLTPSQLQAHITTLSKPRSQIGMMEAERYNLLGLLYICQAKKYDNLPQRENIIRTAILYFHSALFLELTTSSYQSNYQLIQAFTYNLGELAPNYGPFIALVFRISKEMYITANDKNSHWVLLSLCKEFWKRDQKGKSISNMDAVFAELALDMPKTTLPAFWLELVRRAKTTHKSREMSNAYFLALWGLNRIHATGEAKKLQADWQALCKENAELRRFWKVDFALK